MNTLRDLLFARSVAVVGASAAVGKMGHTLLQNLVDGGFQGAVYPVNPREAVLCGLKCCPSLEQVPGQVDLAVLCIPAAGVPQVLEQAGQKGVKGAIIISGGFREIGNGDLERQVLEIARRHGIRVVGPNCQGINYTANRLCATWPLATTAGRIGVVSQSGTIGAELERLAEADGLGVSCFAALGNKLDIDEVDFIRFFLEDSNTDVIALNIEGIGAGSGFLEEAARAAASKPIVVLKPGRTAAGRIAAASHTKSIAGDDRLFSVFCKKYGLMRADTMTEFYEFCKLAALMRPPRGGRLLILTSSGGSGILATDAAEPRGISVAPLPGPLREALAGLLPGQCVPANPLDLTGDATAQRYEAVLRLMAREGGAYFDAVLAIFGDPIPGAADVIARFRTYAELPVLVSYLGGGSVQEEETGRMNRMGIPVFPAPERAVAALAALLGSKGKRGEARA